MHLYCFRFDLVSYASKRRLVTSESSYTHCVLLVLVFFHKFNLESLLLSKIALVQGNCFPLGDLLAERKTDQTLKLRLQGKV